MSVSRDEVRRIAALAGLHPGEAATERLREELARILEHVENLQEADVSGAGEPLRLPDEPLRLPDEPVPFRDPSLEPDPLGGGAPGEIAPDWRDGFFAVPRLPAVEGDEEAE